MFKITILIPTYGSSSLLERTLKSLSECNFPANYSKTIVIENGPKENAEEVCKKFSSIKCEYQYSEVANKSAALNKAIQNLPDDTFVIFFDDDVRLAPQIIIAYSEVFAQYGALYFYGGPMGVDYEIPPKEYYKSFLPPSAKGWKLEEGKSVGVMALMGCNWAVTKKNIALVGGFDEKFGPNSTTGATGQEHDMMYRLNEAGIIPYYIEKAAVWHYVPKERASLAWALDRKYKGGIYAGLRNLAPFKESEVHEDLKRAFLNLLKEGISFSRSTFLKNLFRFQFLRGVSKGIKMNDRIKK